MSTSEFDEGAFRSRVSTALEKVRTAIRITDDPAPLLSLTTVPLSMYVSYCSKRALT